jgi:chromosome segregation ATPase
MTFEEMERVMQFILEQQAQFSVNMDKVRERMAGHEERMAESDERLSRIEGIQENTARQIQHLGDALVALTESQQEEHAQTQEALRELAESQRHTDRRLDALIDIVRGGQDAGQEPQT